MDSDSLRDSFASRQLVLFTDGELTELAIPSNHRSQSMQMDGDCLQGWKAKVFRHQQQVRTNAPEKQAVLLDNSSARHELATVDPCNALLLIALC